MPATNAAEFSVACGGRAAASLGSGARRFVATALPSCVYALGAARHSPGSEKVRDGVQILAECEMTARTAQITRKRPYKTRHLRTRKWRPSLLPPEIHLRRLNRLKRPNSRRTDCRHPRCSFAHAVTLPFQPRRFNGRHDVHLPHVLRTNLARAEHRSVPGMAQRSRTSRL